MKKKMVIVTTAYKQPSPIGGIVEKYLSFFDDYDISIICLAFDNIKTIYCGNRECKIYPISSKLFALRNKLEKRGNFFDHFFIFFLRIINFIKNFLFANGSMMWFADKIDDTLSRINAEETINHIFSFAGDLSVHRGVLKFLQTKEEQIKWTTYTSDLPSILSTNTIRKKQFFNIENEIFKYANTNLVTNEIYNEFCCKKLFIKAPYIMKINDLFNRKTNNSIPVLTYAGRFYRKIRNPKYMLDVFNKVKSCFKLNIYTEGACHNIVSRHANKSKKIFLGKLLNKSEYNLAMLESDFLISHGNSVCGFQPSKIYECVGYGKPIIHFYYNEKDKTLEKYKYCLQIKIGENKMLASIKINDFINRNMNVTINKEEITNIFSENQEASIKDNVKRAIVRA